MKRCTPDEMPECVGRRKGWLWLLASGFDYWDMKNRAVSDQCKQSYIITRILQILLYCHAFALQTLLACHTLVENSNIRWIRRKPHSSPYFPPQLSLSFCDPSFTIKA
eukprot:TRINITY_DN4586_c0_g1_i3.p1 TRINITY_DN4586_c0_g1~~TRINITY_DN4586_c0_g1_i3.p1  ORF type:complete len:108 (-),score=10.15 TRINITY_DN4586_c0_g1_i3:88-411(-)